MLLNQRFVAFLMNIFYTFFYIGGVNGVSSDLCGFTTLRKELLPNDALGRFDTLFSLVF